MAYIHPEEVDDFMEKARAYVEVEVALGFSRRDAMVDEVIGAVGLEEYAEDLEDQLREVRRRVEELVDELVTQDDAKQATWPEVTDCDRLDAAFGLLQEDQILAAQRFGPDPEIGRERVLGYIEELPAEERPRGFVFLDDETILDCFHSNILQLNFGVTDNDPERAMEIGRTIVARLKEIGFRPVWDRKPESRICLEGFLWRRRRPT